MAAKREMRPADSVLIKLLAAAPETLELSCSELHGDSYQACWAGRLEDGTGLAAFGMGPTREAAIVAASLTLERALDTLPNRGRATRGALGLLVKRGQA